MTVYLENDLTFASGRRCQEEALVSCVVVEGMFSEISGKWEHLTRVGEAPDIRGD